MIIILHVQTVTVLARETLMIRMIQVVPTLSTVLNICITHQVSAVAHHDSMSVTHVFHKEYILIWQCSQLHFGQSLTLTTLWHSLPTRILSPVSTHYLQLLNLNQLFIFTNQLFLQCGPWKCSMKFSATNFVILARWKYVKKKKDRLGTLFCSKRRDLRPFFDPGSQSFCHKSQQSG